MPEITEPDATQHEIQFEAITDTTNDDHHNDSNFVRTDGEYLEEDIVDQEEINEEIIGSDQKVTGALAGNTVSESTLVKRGNEFP